MKPAEDSHYLRQELYELILNDPSVFDFLQGATLDGVWYWDLVNPEHEWMSPEFWLFLGYSPAQKQHLASEWQDLIHPEDLVIARKNLEKHLDNPAHPYDQIVRYTKKNGKIVWVRCRGIAIRDQFDQPVRMLGAHVDVTKLMEVTELLEIQLQRLDACKMRLSLEQQKVSQLAHEKSQLEGQLQQKEKEIQVLKQRVL
ncbi:PAS domain-containing protein [Acaryochloris marina]|uniref:histidine kinase n=1 Tax=Acaryochloris marina (strain MBIC 11017) TaxID=329726 RepID=B0C1J6_ACAM1|nr:PAS domain-containing protein [Acaryochloris marina]ABW30830.1 PAS domain S-box [Acaryochloris marina MBIC11017]BDM79581.1 hypothetical protein AM10699_24490 [Acaryochloris marina MBIC10699]